MKRLSKWTRVTQLLSGRIHTLEVEPNGYFTPVPYHLSWVREQGVKFSAIPQTMLGDCFQYRDLQSLHVKVQILSSEAE